MTACQARLCLSTNAGSVPLINLSILSPCLLPGLPVGEDITFYSPNKTRLGQLIIFNIYGCSLLFSFPWSGIWFYISLIEFCFVTFHEGAQWEQRFGSTLSLTSALYVVCGKRYSPASLPPGMTRCASGTVRKSAENFAPTGFRSQDRPARSESLYRLSYPVPLLMNHIHTQVERKTAHKSVVVILFTRQMTPRLVVHSLMLTTLLHPLFVRWFLIKYFSCLISRRVLTFRSVD